MTENHDSRRHGGGDSKPEPAPKPSVASCCGGSPEPEPESAKSSCCGGGENGGGRKTDRLLWTSAILIAAGYAIHWLAPGAVAAVPWLARYCMGVFDLMNKMWWGVLLGILMVGLLARVPREIIVGALGKPGRLGGLLRATAAGVMLDLCSHGILLVGMQLYRRGASLGQTMAFLIASPWNSLSLTLILIALIGWKWTLAFLALSAAIALLSGWLFERLVAAGTLPANPNAVDLPEDFRLFAEMRRRLRATRFGAVFWRETVRSAFSESGMILRWIFFGTVLAALLRAFFSPEIFGSWFGPSVAGLALTLAVATVLEVCSEGSSPIAADLLSRAGAPGNAFTFLMAGVATDYTEILSLRETTRSWKIALFLPLVTVPQVVAIGWLLNRFG